MINNKATIHREYPLCNKYCLKDKDSDKFDDIHNRLFLHGCRVRVKGKFIYKQRENQ